jgi:endonuclease YncB( thermonuclease family)
MFSKDGGVLTEDELYVRMGLSNAGIKAYAYDTMLFRNRALAELMTQDYLKSIWNPPEGGYVRDTAVITLIKDADTFSCTLSNGDSATIRLAGVDAPEVIHDNTGAPDEAKSIAGGMRRGIASYEYLTKTLGVTVGSTVILYTHPQDSTMYKDNYDRILAFVHTESGENVNVELIRSGNAIIYGSTED